MLAFLFVSFIVLIVLLNETHKRINLKLNLILKLVTQMKKSDYLNKATQIIDERNNKILEKRDSLSLDMFDNEAQYKKAYKSETRRVEENRSIKAALAFNDLAQLFYQHNISIQAIIEEQYSNTREFKKRLVRTLQAIAQNDFEELSFCDFTLYKALFTGKLKNKDLTLDQIRNYMMQDGDNKSHLPHRTNTQARYISNFAQQMKFAKVVKKDKQTFVTFDLESAFAKKIHNLFV